MSESQAHAVDLHVGMRLRLRRKFLGMSQSELANGLNLTFQQVQKYERGANRISSSMLYKAAQLLQVPISYFFDSYEEVSEQEQPSSSEEAIYRFLKTSEGLELAQSFPRIPKAIHRRRIMELVRTMSSDDDDD